MNDLLTARLFRVDAGGIRAVEFLRMRSSVSR